MCAKDTLLPAATTEMIMRALLDGAPIGRSGVPRIRSWVCRWIKHGPISHGSAKATGTSTPIGRSITEARPRQDPTQGNAVPSRYSVYRYEIEQGYVADVSPGGESGAPACYLGDNFPAASDRRILYAAVINCQSLRLESEAQSNVPVAAFGKFFALTQSPRRRGRAAWAAR